ncbi:MAG: hypothetical protein ACLFUJ_16895 [Phycisphaerae bacterium]
MAKKMYYNEEEAADALGISPEELAVHVQDNKLRVFQDGAKKMYLAQEVEQLASQMSSTGEIELTPADTAAGDVVSLEEADSDADSLSDTGKDDTVITAEGISIFDDEDLEIEAADPMAKTQIAPSLEDQIALEGVGSGSGLLDLTRESDDTSLGAEVLDNIDVEGVGAEIIEEDEHADYVPQAAPVPVPVPTDPLAIEDGSSGLFGGFAIGGALVAVLILLVALPVMRGMMPDYVYKFANNLTAVAGGGVLIIAIGGLIGYFIGKSAGDRKAAMRMKG